MADLIGRSAVEVARFLEPLRVALEDGDEFAFFIRRFGFAIGPDEVTAAITSLSALRDGIVALIDAAEAARADGIQLSDAQALIAAAGPLFDATQSTGSIVSSLSGALPSGPTFQPLDEAAAGFPDELFDLLLADYLDARLPVALHLLALLDVFNIEEIPEEGHPLSRGLAYARHDFNWARIQQVFDRPDEWARDAYGWGVDFDSDTFIGRLVRLVEFVGGVARLNEMSEAALTVFLPQWPNPNIPPLQALVPVIRHDVLTQDGAVDVQASGEAGVSLFPIEGETLETRTTDKGLAVAPYADTNVSGEVDLGGGLAARVHGAAGAVGGVVFALRPSGMDVKTGVGATAFTGSVAFEISYAPEGGVVFVGQPNSTRIEAQAIVGSFGAEVSNAGSDLYVAGGVKALKAVIDPGDDGLLSAVIANPIEIDASDILVGWRYGRGLYFEGGSSLAITIPVHLNFGVIRITELTLVLDWSEPASVTLAVTGNLKIGPLFAYAQGIGLETLIVPDPDGMLGNYDLQFAFKPPDAYAISLDIAPITGGGMIARYDHEYRGALALEFESIGFSAFALLNTRMPDGQPGFSFAASLFAEFTMPLGYGFFLTGLGGVMGLNRTINTDALREVLFAGRLDNLLFPADPIGTAATILQDLADILPVRAGQHVVGPVARIGWGQPVLIEIKLGVVVELGANVRAVIVGSVSTNLPTKDAALVSLTVSFFGVIDFGAGTISFDGTLQNSRVLNWSITGDGAFRTGWARRLDHIASVGGLHPDYPRPANFPDLRRLTINFGTNNPKITLTAYAALTVSSAQFGAMASLYAKGPDVWLVGQLAAEGEVYFHALVYFNPFGFDVLLGGSLTLLRNGKRAAGLGFKLRLRGPNTYKISGKVWVTICGVDVDFSIKHTWGEPQSLPIATASAVALLRAAIERRARFEPLVSTRRGPGVGYRSTDSTKEAIDPAFGVRFMQRDMPLGETLAKVGETQITGPKRLDLAVFDGSEEISVGPAPHDFVRGQFFDLSEAERLRGPGYDELNAGFEYASDALDFSVAHAITETYDYEIIKISIEDDRTTPATPGGVLTLADRFANRWAGVTHMRVAVPANSPIGVLRPVDPIVVGKTRFVPASAVTAIAAATPGDRAAALASASTSFTRLMATAPVRLREANAGVADYVVAATARGRS